MGIFLGNKLCENCSRSYDGAKDKCPHCGYENPDPRSRGFINFEPPGVPRELALCFGGYLMLTFVAAIVQFIYIGIFSASYTGSETDYAKALNDYLMAPSRLSVIQYVSYGVVAVAVCALFIGHWKPLLRKFRPKRMYWAAIAFIGMYAFNIFYSLILNAAGVSISDNENQSLVVSLVRYNVPLAIIFLGLVGPLVEEFIYRVGAFGLLSRINKYAAYVLGAIIFGLIHFDFTNPSVNELLNLPNYIVPGLLLCLAYDKCGLIASYSVHALNNVLSVILAAAGVK